MKEEKAPATESDPRKAQPVQTGDLDQALKRIREEYDGDLNAFFRDVQAKVVKQRNSDEDHAEFCVQ